MVSRRAWFRRWWRVSALAGGTRRRAISRSALWQSANDDRSDEGTQDATPVEDVTITDTENDREDEVADQRSDQAEHDRNEQDFGPLICRKASPGTACGPRHRKTVRAGELRSRLLLVHTDKNSALYNTNRCRNRLSPNPVPPLSVAAKYQPALSRKRPSQYLPNQHRLGEHYAQHGYPRSA